MCDNHIYCAEYKNLKDLLVGIMNGEHADATTEEIEQRIHDLYASGKMSGTQYDDLIRLPQEINI